MLASSRIYFLALTHTYFLYSLFIISAGVGAPAPSSMFGAPVPAVGLFGAAQQPAPATSFGAPAAPAANLFGSPPAPAATTAGGSMGNYTPTSKQDGTSSISLQAISAMPQFENKSFEELRWEDYAQGNKGGSTPPQGNTAGFGSTFGGGAAAPAPGTSLFGATPAAPFGQQQQPAFPAHTPFGSPAPAQQPFGQQPAPAPGFFGGTPAPAPTAFASSAVSHIVDPPPVPFGVPGGGNWVPYKISVEGASFVFEWRYVIVGSTPLALHSRVVHPPTDLAANFGQAWTASITTKGGRRVFELRPVDPNNAGP